MSSNPYAAPGSAIEIRKAQVSPVRRRVLTAFVLFGGAVLAFALAFVVALESARRFGTTALLVAAVIGAVGTVRGILALVAAIRAPAPRARLIVLAALAATLNLGMTVVGAFAAFLSTMTFSRGRQLRKVGRVLLPPLAPGGAWAKGEDRIQIEEADRGALAARWRENARTEHASVAAFARLTLDLVALGAPPALVASAQRDALDEIAHTAICFALARAIDGADVGPGPFPEAARARTLPRIRGLALAVLAVDSLVDGALHEGVSARVVAKLAPRCQEPTIRTALKRIAADEGRHAAHGWDVVEWCLAEGGEGVASALSGALRSLPAAMPTLPPGPAADGAWEKWGVHGQTLEAEEYAKAREHVERRVRELVASVRMAA